MPSKQHQLRNIFVGRVLYGLLQLQESSLANSHAAPLSDSIRSKGGGEVGSEREEVEANLHTVRNPHFFLSLLYIHRSKIKWWQWVEENDRLEGTMPFLLVLLVRQLNRCAGGGKSGEIMTTMKITGSSKAAK